MRPPTRSSVRTPRAAATATQNALKLTDGLVDKYPDSSLVKALRAMALTRLGKHADANKVRHLGLPCCPGHASSAAAAPAAVGIPWRLHRWWTRC